MIDPKVWIVQLHIDLEENADIIGVGATALIGQRLAERAAGYPLDWSYDSGIQTFQAPSRSDDTVQYLVAPWMVTES